ncbi:DnaJ family domain-containing protein [Nocardia asteroides]|uniref:DnaJ family domain-containing protein n=1 Tax=Nocardia asteroides TaxID=1824 RepID=UPI001E2F4C58|nr:DnaJ family domain-containing protein [Nocardia asteroides]UGT63913.1 DUF1992 domain-containing protein [Nocardia asteroides]
MGADGSAGRKPARQSFESWVDKQVREAEERGELRNLRGSGKPIPGAGAPVQEDAWLRGYLQREGADTGLLLPTPLLLRRDAERIGATVRDCTTEEQVRAEVVALNRRIVEYLRIPSGPVVPVSTVDVEAVVAEWRREREEQRRAARAVAKPVAPPPPKATKRPWWRRRRRAAGG